MGIQKKHGKGRLDRWYKLAKEKGYRARAAFKLIQLNQKYHFLERSKVLLDLCAAPGSWCQVAAETMPANSLIVGLDLAPIKPIPRTITFQSDITTDKCRATIRQHLKTWKADTVLHDGAPNVGTAWIQDAYSQAELVLQAMKLATDFLVEGGTFVTKVFRSKDYNALLWVFKQLFEKVEATKPPSSRNVSAEIFVVCRVFKAPKHLDPKFLDPQYVFAELSDPTPNNEAKVFNPEQKKRKREGYEEGNYLQFKEAPASEFVQTNDPITMLGSLNKLSFDQSKHDDIALAALDRLPETTPDIRLCCMDLRVLGRKEFRTLLKWRLRVRDIFGFTVKKALMPNVLSEETAEVTPIDEEIQALEDLEKLGTKESAHKKRNRRRENERKQKEIVRLQMHMMPATEIGLEQANTENSMFALATLSKAEGLRKANRDMTDIDSTSLEQPSSEETSDQESDEEEDLLDAELDTLYKRYQERKSDSDAKYRAKKARKECRDEDWEGFSEHEDRSANECDMDQATESSDEDDHQLRQSIGTIGQSRSEVSGLSQRAAAYFEQEIFTAVGAIEAEITDNGPVEPLSERSRASKREPSAETERRLLISKRSTKDWNSEVTSSGQELFERSPSIVSETNPSNSGQQDQDIGDTFEVVKAVVDTGWESQDESRNDGGLEIDIITAEAMTLAQRIASGQKTTYELIDDGFNKYTFRDRDGLPEWFLDDEGRHSRPNRPITTAGASAIKEKLRALNARPIKKVREAKDRKKFKAAQRLEKLRKKSALVADDEGISEKDKAQSIAKMMKKASKGKPKQQVKLVVARGGNRGISGRPRGVKGKYKIVDARLKKDVRAEKRLAKKRR